MGSLTCSAALLSIALAAGPVPASQAAAPSVDGSRIVTADTPGTSLLRAQPTKPSVTRLTPKSGPTTGAIEVVIKGQRLTDVKRVIFGTVPATDVRTQGARKLVVKAPPQAAGQVRVRVVTKHGASKRTSATGFTYVTRAPALTRVTPAAGPTVGDTRVTLTGTDLTGATTVRFGSAVATSVVVSSPTTIVATTSSHAVGTVNVTVTTGGGSASLDDGFSYAAAPTLSFVDPGSGPLVETPATLVGTALTAGAQVTFGGAPAAVLSASPDGTELTVTTPDHAAGFVDVVVTTVGGSTTLVHGYLFVGGTTLTGVTPSVGPSSGGGFVTLTGTGFTGDTLVTFANKPSLQVFANVPGTELTALLPSHAAGTVDVSVATTGGSATLAGGFTYVDAPTLDTITPTTGPAGGGTSVTLNGTHFRAGMQVRLGGVPATGFTLVSATQATAVTPAHSPGAVDVSVTTPGGTATLPGGYTYVAAPTLATVSPNEGPATGGQSVTLTGTDFRAGMQVWFGGTLATLVSVDPSGTVSTVTMPVHAAGVVDVSVTTPGGVATFAGGYTYVTAPALTAVSPDVGPVGGGTTVTLTGSDFRPGMQVRFGTTAAALVSVNPGGTSATVTTPAQAAAGVVDISVTTPGGTATLGNAFTYVAAPTLTAVAPNEGPTAGGQSVTLTGSGFRSGMQVRFGGDPAPLGSVNPAGTSATVTTPAHAAIVVDVSVMTPGGSDTLHGGYTYVVAPTLTAVSPETGPTAGGTPVTITGTHLSGTTGVTFEGMAATDVAVVNDSTVTATTPAHASGFVDVVVSTPGGSATLAAGFEYVAAPTLSSASPNAGPIDGGTSVTLFGNGLGGTTTVTFDGLPATGVMVVNDNIVVVTTPAHVAGPVDVVLSTPGGQATLNGYTYLAPPEV